jgi:hypothetical protein
MILVAVYATTALLKAKKGFIKKGFIKFTKGKTEFR